MGDKKKCESCGCVDSERNGNCYKITLVKDFPDVGRMQNVDLCEYCYYDGDPEQVFKNANRQRREDARKRREKR